MARDIRELRNVLCRAVARLDDEVVIYTDRLEFDAPPLAPTLCRLRPGTSDEEIARALIATRGNRAAAARRLGIARSTLYVRRVGFAGTSGSTGSRERALPVWSSFVMVSLPSVALSNYRRRRCLGYVGR